MMTFRFTVKTFQNQLPVIRGNPELSNMMASPSMGLLKPAGWGERQSQWPGDRKAAMSRMLTPRRQAPNTYEPSTSWRNCNTNILLVQNKTNDKYLHNTSKGLKMKLFGGYHCDYVVSMRVNTTCLICNSITMMKLT